MRSAPAGTQPVNKDGNRAGDLSGDFMSADANLEVMPPTLVAVAVGVLLAVALLGPAFDRRSVAIVAAAAAIPDLDAAFALVGPGAPNAVLHSVFIPIGAGVALYYDTQVREESWLAGRYGWYGIRVAWVALAAYTVAGIGLDAFSTEGAALLYPVSDRYYAIVGRLLVSTQEGLIQTYVTIGNGWIEVASPGTTETHTVETWLTGDERRLRIVESGWQAVIVTTAVAAMPAKWLIERADRAGGRR